MLIWDCLNNRRVKTLLFQVPCIKVKNNNKDFMTAPIFYIPLKVQNSTG